MPRKVAPEDQSTDLVDRIVAESSNTESTWVDGRGLYDEAVDVTEAAIASYLEWSSARPSSLREEYHSCWPLEGKIEPGKTLRTASGAPLVLDPFHRSNPFRHAFHPGHGKGRNITRHLSLEIEGSPVSLTNLKGTYTETLQGLIGGNLVSRGTFTLKRVNQVNTLIK